MEVWKDIEGYEGLYQVSNLGRVKSLERYFENHSKLQKLEGKIKAIRIDTGGYYTTDLYCNNKQRTWKVHRLVAMAFIPNPEKKPTVNHKDGNKLNNNVDNLEWCTQHEQNEHFYRLGLKSKENIDKAIKAMNKANAKKVKCLETGVVYESASDAGRKIGISSSLVMMCCRGKRKSCGKDKNNKPLHWAYI